MVAETVPQGLKRKLGRLGYLLWAGWSAASFNAFRLKIKDGTRTYRLWATEVRIANGRFHGGVELIENADVESGQILVQAVAGGASSAWAGTTSLRPPSCARAHGSFVNIMAQIG